MTTTPPPPAKPTPGPDPGPPHVRVEMLSCPRFLAGAREMVASLARRLGFSEVGASQIALAVDEALANVIRHGYERREDQPIWMMIWQLDDPPQSHDQPAPAGGARPSGLRIVIEDMGRQIEPAQIKGRDLDDIKPGGLGVHIIKEVMDEVAYEKRPAGGMRLTLVKRPESVKDRAGPRGADAEAGGAAPPAISVHTPGSHTSASQSSPRGRGNVHG